MSMFLGRSVIERYASDSDLDRMELLMSKVKEFDPNSGLVSKNRKKAAEDEWISVLPVQKVGENFSKLLNSHNMKKYLLTPHAKGQMKVGSGSLTKDHRSVLTAYTGPQFEEYNVLLLIDSKRLETDKDVGDCILRLVDACRVGNDLGRNDDVFHLSTLPFFTFRTLRLSAEEFAEYQNICGEKFYSPAFMSTTTNRSVADGWKGNTLVRVWLRNPFPMSLGSEAIDLKPFSLKKNEDEIMIPAYSIFRVLHATVWYEDDIVDPLERHFQFGLNIELIGRDYSFPTLS